MANTNYVIRVDILLHTGVAAGTERSIITCSITRFCQHWLLLSSSLSVTCSIVLHKYADPFPVLRTVDFPLLITHTMKYIKWPQVENNNGRVNQAHAPTGRFSTCPKEKKCRRAYLLYAGTDALGQGCQASILRNHSTVTVGLPERPRIQRQCQQGKGCHQIPFYEGPMGTYIGGRGANNSCVNSHPSMYLAAAQLFTATCPAATARSGSSLRGSLQSGS